ncbi:hypothetical protein CBS101457_006686 [Exobasidium rhododendri]|nr:hypothetical protein CBS101457_006686 [Exobasidium rhododendri]
MDGVTLIESGTSRRHFALLKRVESVKSPSEADGIVLSTIAEVQSALSSRNAPSLSFSSLASNLLVLLQCLELYSASTETHHTQLNIQFALVPSLQLASTATKAKDILLAYTVLKRLYESQDEQIQQQTSLLILNTIRSHLESGLVSAGDSKGKRRRRTDAIEEVTSTSFSRIYFALKSIIAGFPAGPDIFPALYGPVSLLCKYPDEQIQSLALNALGRIRTYVEFEESIERADWERAKRILVDYCKKPRNAAVEGKSLSSALLRSIKRAVEAEVIDVDAGCEHFLALLLAQPEMSTAGLRECMMMAKRYAGSKEVLERLKTLTAESCLRNKEDYSATLSSAQLLGEMADVGRADDPLIKAVWTLISSHLKSKNINRIVLALSALEAFLPYSWPSAGNEAGLELKDEEMGILMEMLGHRDGNIRTRTLHLFKNVDGSILDVHYGQLVQVSKDESRPEEERKALIQRAIEVAGERLNGHDVDKAKTSEQYAAAVCDVLSIHIDNRISDGAIHLVLLHLRRVPPNLSSMIFSHLLEKEDERQQSPSSTFVLLSASLACELECDEDACKIVLQGMTSMLQHLHDQVLMEALLVGMIKLASKTREDDSRIVTSIEELKESSESSLIKQRCGQLLQLFNDPTRKGRIQNGSLLATIDRIEAYFTVLSSRPSPDVGHSAKTTARNAVKPLNYEPYQISPQSSLSTTSSGKNKNESNRKQQPYSALPPPSARQDERMRRHRKIQEDCIREDMQKSIASLTMGNEEAEEYVDDTVAIKKEDGVLF